MVVLSEEKKTGSRESSPIRRRELDGLQRMVGGGRGGERWEE